MPPMTPKSREYEILRPAALRLGLHPFDTPLLINSVPYNGRSACMRIRWCVGFGCETNAKNGTQNTVIPRALATGNAWLRTECKVKEVLLDDRGRATGVAYFDENDRLQEQPADVVVVSGGATESARLLLLSKSRLHPSGLGNRHDWVGRNLNGHTYTGAVGLLRAGDLRRHRPGGVHLGLRLQPRHAGARAAAACSPTSSSACPTSSRTTSRRARRRGARPTRTSCAGTTGGT